MITDLASLSLGPVPAFEVQASGDGVLTRLAALAGESVEQVIRRRAPAMARALASYTQPVADADSGGAVARFTASYDGEGKLARDMGRAAVRRDVYRVYMSPTQAFKFIKAKLGHKTAKTLYALLKTADLLAAKKLCEAGGLFISVMGWDHGALHHRFRNAKGRVSNRQPVALVADGAALKRYVKEEEGFVGFAKSGWVSAGRSVQGGEGGRVPAWMRQQDAPGHSKADVVHDQFQLDLINDVSYIDSIFTERYYNRATEAFERNLEREAERIIIAQIRKLN